MGAVLTTSEILICQLLKLQLGGNSNCSCYPKIDLNIPLLMKHLRNSKMDRRVSERQTKGGFHTL